MMQYKELKAFILNDINLKISIVLWEICLPVQKVPE